MKSFNIICKIIFIVFLCLFVFLQCDYISGDKTIASGGNGSNEPDYREAPLIVPTTDEYYILGGDILLDNTDEDRDKEIIQDMLDYMEKQLAEDANTNVSQSVIGAPENTSEYYPIKKATVDKLIKKWTWAATSGVIPYYYNDIPGWEDGYGTLQNKIRQAMNLIETQCNVHFIQIPVDMDTYGTIPVYKIYNNTENRSTIGPVNRPRMDVREDAELFTIVHLLGHCLGLQHEHQRYDRDSYVQINWNNIIANMRYKYVIIPHKIKYYTYKKLPFHWVKVYTHTSLNSVTFGEYDYDSIMHAGHNSDAINSEQRTVIPVDSEGQEIDEEIGQRSHISYIDKIGLEALYGKSRIPHMAVYRSAQGSATNAITVISGQPWSISADNDQEFLVQINPPEAGGTFGKALQFTIENSGRVPLILSGDTIITITGDPEFSIIKYPSRNIPGGTYSNFLIRLFTETPGSYEAEISIENNSHNRIFSFPIRGTAYEPSQIQAVPWEPDNLQLDVISNNQINLSWDDNSDIETGFSIYRKDNEATGFIHVADVGPDTTYFEDTSVYYNSGNWWDRVWYQVYAYNDFGRSEIVGARLPAAAISYWDLAFWDLFSYWE